MEAIETNISTRVNGNVPNRKLITNLPEGCCVEVPCLVDANGIQPTYVGSLPPQLAAINRTNINVQELIVEAALTGRKDAVYHAVMLDPLTAAVCTLPQIHNMATEMLLAQQAWLPQFHPGKTRWNPSSRTTKLVDSNQVGATLITSCALTGAPLCDLGVSLKAKVY